MERFLYEGGTDQRTKEERFHRLTLLLCCENQSLILFKRIIAVIFNESFETLLAIFRITTVLQGLMPRCMESTFCALSVSERFTLRSYSTMELVIPRCLLLVDKSVRFPQSVILLYVCHFLLSDLKAFITYPLFVKTLCLRKRVNANEKFLY